MSTSITHAHATTPLTKIILLALVWLPIIGVISAIVLLWNHWVNWLDLALLLVMYTINLHLNSSRLRWSSSAS